MSNSNDRSDSVELIDIVFTAVLTIGLTPELLQISHIRGMLSEDWVKAAYEGNWRLPSAHEFTHLVLFTVGALTLLLSWFGVHASLRRQPIKYESGFGMFRFMLDVALVLSYGLVLIFFKQLQIVVFLLAVIYTTFFFWDILKTLEYRDVYWTDAALIKAGLRNRPVGASPTGWIEKVRKNASQDWQWVVAGWRHFQRQLVSLIFAISFWYLLASYVTASTKLLAIGAFFSLFCIAQRKTAPVGPLF